MKNRRTKRRLNVRSKTLKKTGKKARPNLKLKKYVTLNKRMKKRREKKVKKIGGFLECKGKRDGVSGCRICCAKYVTGNHKKCIHVCMST